MSSINQATLIGRLGQNPRMSQTHDGNPVANFSLATSSAWKDKRTGERKEKTQWHNITFFGPVANIVGEYARKGTQVAVIGRIEYSEYTDREGNTKPTTNIVGERFTLLGNPNNNSSSTTTPENEGGASFPPEDDLPY